MNLEELTQAVSDSITNGTPLQVQVSDVAEAANITNPAGGGLASITPVGVSFPLGNLAKLSPLLPGCTLFGMIPVASSVLGDALTTDISLDLVNFQVAPGCQYLSSVQLELSFTTPPTIAAGNFTIELDSIDVVLTMPGIDGVSPQVLLSGAINLSPVPLNVSISLPDLTVSISYSDPSNPPTIDSILAPCGVDTSLFGNLSLSEFFFSIELLPPTGPPPCYLQFMLTSLDASYPLLDGLGMALSFDGTNWSPSISAVFNPASLVDANNILLFQTLLSYSNQTWTIEGGLDVFGTLYALNPSNPGTELTLSTILQQFGATLPGNNMFQDVSIAALSVSATIPSTGGERSLSAANIQVAINAQVDIQWMIDKAPYTLDTAVSYTYVQNGTSSGSLTGNLNLAGNLVLTLGASWGSDTTLNASISGWDGWGMKGSLDTGTSIAIITITPPINATFADLLGEFVATITGEPYTTLPEPWDQLFSYLLPTSIDLSVNMQTNTYSVSLEGLNISVVILTITQIDLTYSSSGGFSMNLHYSGALPGITNPVAWDPTDPAAAPNVPGFGASKLEILLAAAGQNLVFPTQPVDAPTALAGLSKMLTSTTPSFAANAGWTLGLHLMILGQAEIQLAFCDPTLYALQLNVNKNVVPSGASGSAYLAALVGLSAEVIYRRINPTLGLFEAALTLPSSIQNIDLGMFQLHLPSISVEIYTDGEFSFDVGFPYNGDFSQSASIVAETYTGAGGIYLARLSNWTAPSLPQVTGSGSFGTVTEIGIGLQLGVYYGFSSGPLSASLSATISGIFQGVFATYTDFADQQSVEYYNVTASVIFAGKIQGSINFPLISASVLIQVSASASINAIAGQPTQMMISASLSATATVKVYLVLCTITHNFSFTATLSYTAVFGSSSPQPWNAKSPALEMPESLPWPFGWNLKGHFHPLPGGVLLTAPLYLIPVLTANDNGWLYSPQFFLDDPTSTQPTAIYIFAWFIQAYCYAHHEDMKETHSYTDLPVSTRMLTELQEFLHRPEGAGCIRATDLQQFFSTNFSLTMQGIASTAGAELAPFPIVPGLNLSMSLTVDSKATTIAPLPFSTEAQETILTEYVTLVGLSMISAGLQSIAGLGQSVSLGSLIQAMIGNSLPDALATVSRFMLHGTQTGSPAVGLYQATGQMFPIAANTGDAIAMTAGGDAAAEYGIGFASGNSLTLSSSDSSPSVYSGALIAGFDQTLLLTNFAVKSMDQTVPVDSSYQLAAGSSIETVMAQSPAGALQTLSTAMQQNLLDGDITVSDYVICQGFGSKNEEVIASDTYVWGTAVSFQIHLGPQNPPVPIYALGKLQGDTLQDLVSLYQLLTGASAPLATIEILAPSGAGMMTTYPVDDATVFVYQQNQSTTAEPSERVHEKTEGGGALAPGMLSLGLLLASALTNSGGYSLYLGPAQNGLAPSTFDPSGLATLTMVVSLASVPANFQSLNAVRFQPSSGVQGATPLVALSSTVTTPQPAFPLGTIGVAGSYTPNLPTPMPATDPTYQISLTGLFNLVGMRPTLTLPNKGQLSNPPFLVTGPYLDLAGNENYQQTVDLFAWSGNRTLMLYRDASTAKLRPLPSALLDPENDPYQFIGATLSVTAACVDLYGNLLASPQATSSAVLQWTEPLIAPAAWPGLSMSYLIEEDLLHLHPVLRLQLDWKLPSAQITETQRISIMLQYARIYQQLARSTVSVTCSILQLPLTETSSLFGSKVLNAVLQERVRLILDALYLGVVSHLPLPDIQFALNDRDSSYTAQVLCPLNTSITLTMTGMPPATSVILPQHNDNEDTGSASIRKFAFKFELALKFLGAKLMIGQTVEVGAPNLYFLNTGGNGMRITVTPMEGENQTTFVGYAPQPLGQQTYMRTDIATTGLAALIANPNGVTNQFTPPSNATVSCTNMDVDVSMNGFLNTLDALLAPDTAIPASLIGDGILQQMITAKEQIADTLSQTVLSLSAANQGEGDPQASASQCYEQEMLRSASSFYNVDAVAVYSVAVTNPPSSSMNLFGHMKLTRDDVTISPFNCPVSSGSGFAPIAVSVRTKGSLDELAMPTSLRINALEIDLQTVTITTDGAGNQSDYTFGTWLEYAIPFEKPMDIPAVTVSLPLRACPQPVQLLQQNCASASSLTAAPISQTLHWGLTGTYQRNYIAQDSLLVTIVTNTTEEDTHAPSGTGQDIVDALALYNFLYPQIAPYLGASLQDQVPLLAIGSEAKDAIAAFAGAANYIQQCLPVAARGVTGPPRVGNTYVYEISEGPASATDDTWVMLVHQVSGGIPLSALVPSIPGCQTTPLGQYPADQPIWMSYGFVTDTRIFSSGELLLSAAQAKTITTRTLQLGGFFDVLGVQNAQMSIATERNKYLSPDSSYIFPSAFFYQTPSIAFPTPAQPALQVSDALDLTTLPVKGTTMNVQQALIAFLNQLLSTGFTTAPPTVSVDLHLSFNLPLLLESGQASTTLPPVSFPIGFVTGPQMPTNPSEDNSVVSALAAAAAGAVSQWNSNFSATALPWSVGSIAVVASLFTEPGTQSVPALVLSGLYIPTAKLAALTA